MKEFNYVNGLGYPKKIVVYEKNEEGLYPVVLWDMTHGEFCGSAQMSAQEIRDYLLHYHVDETFEEE